MSELKLPPYTFGVGDRFAREAVPQLRACILAAQEGVQVSPVWNKSHREHSTVGSEPQSVRDAAVEAVTELGYTQPYFVDADHINLSTVDGYLASADFFTLDVADAIGQPAKAEDVEAFVARHPELTADIAVEGIEGAVELSRDRTVAIAEKYLFAVQDAGRIYRHIAEKLGAGTFVTEVSMDETDAPQTPPELLVILAAMSDEKIPLQTVAPKFTGRFNKGVDYVGDVAQFEREFNDDLAVIAHAVSAYGLPTNLKLSVHSGSDKFSIYGPIRRALVRTGAGVHVKTAGTNWLEELIGLAEAGGAGLQLAKEVYVEAHAKSDALCAPYAAVIDIDVSQLPDPSEIAGWTGGEYAAALRHDQSNPRFNAHFRQLLHVGYKVAAQMGDRYLDMLEECRPSIEKNVTENLLDRHIRPLFLA